MWGGGGGGEGRCYGTISSRTHTHLGMAQLIRAGLFEELVPCVGRRVASIRLHPGLKEGGGGGGLSHGVWQMGKHDVLTTLCVCVYFASQPP